MIQKLKDESSMLHVFPCGNVGSFEYKLCSLRKDGINESRGNRFFFEDKGHVRRMTTTSCASLFASYGYTLKQAFYSNQYHGAVNWITNYNPFFIIKMFNPLQGKNITAKFILAYYLVKFISISSLRLPFLLHKKFKHNVLLGGLLNVPFRISAYFDKYLISKAEQEWNTLNMQPNGSEMYLYFNRNK
ncbi:hypothetical protein MCHI_003426 [Candidatus Magnetoovum chiemensis]|nr:hypothetical protein MCHI_003426 [Candidatus Magnetoovum chiemensis]